MFLIEESSILPEAFTLSKRQKICHTFGRKICICLRTVEKRRVKHFGQRFNHLQKCHGCNLGQLTTHFDPDDDDEDGDGFAKLLSKQEIISSDMIELSCVIICLPSHMCDHTRP